MRPLPCSKAPLSPLPANDCLCTCAGASLCGQALEGMLRPERGARRGGGPSAGHAAACAGGRAWLDTCCAPAVLHRAGIGAMPCLTATLPLREEPPDCWRRLVLCCRQQTRRGSHVRSTSCSSTVRVASCGSQVLSQACCWCQAQSATELAVACCSLATSATWRACVALNRHAMLLPPAALPCSRCGVGHPRRVCDEEHHQVCRPHAGLCRPGRGAG